ncbi:putative maltose permease [Dactylonectria macrodidyma]|uniref:Maltose permease n=1 Tax=Dactylonectria macrodidyma TaxID=307937 RepID=A0A9P9F841_9HYPO|nr:putative maltose permease [Dactylonectria macrodidyma]
MAADKFILIAVLVNLGNLDYGLDTGIINGFQAMPGFLAVFGYPDPMLPGGYGIDTTVQQLITSLMSVGMIFAAFMAGPITQYIGRKGGIWLGCVLVCISITMQMLVTNHGGLYASRILLYMQEVSPAHMRSLNYTIYITWVSIGSFVGAIINNYCSKIQSRASYRIPLSVIYAMTFVTAAVIIPLPETPRYLATKGKAEQAQKSLRWLRDAAYTDTQVKNEMSEIQRAIELDLAHNASIGFRDLFCSGNTRRTLTSIAVATYAGAAGSQFIIQYGVYFFVVSGNGNPFQSSVIVLAVGLFGSLVSPFYNNKVGKRPMLMLATVVQAFCMLGAGVAASVRGLDPVATNVILAMTCIFMFTFCAVTTPFGWQVAAEIPSQPLRAHTFGVATAVSFITTFLLTFTGPYFINPTELNWGAKYAYVWVPTNLACAIFTFFYMPETNKRTLEEIDECFVAGVHIRKFPSYQATGALEARHGEKS